MHFTSRLKCLKSEKLVYKQFFHLDRFILNVVAASYALGTGISSVLKNCNSGESLEACLQRRGQTRQTLLDEVLKTTWTISDDTSKNFNITPDSPLVMKFNNMRYWDIGFDIVILNVENGLIQESRVRPIIDTIFVSVVYLLFYIFIFRFFLNERNILVCLKYYFFTKYDKH